jgi:hypothetical protein
MKRIIAKECIKPHQCVLAFGIPTTKEDFTNDLKLPNKDFAKRCKCFTSYRKQIIDPLNKKVEPVLTRLGVKVVHKLTFSDFGSLFQNNRFDVIILFSHWKDEAVEFYDGLVTISKILEQVPFNFSGIIDLCVCHPDSLRIRLDFERPNCAVKISKEKINAFIWLRFYENLFIYLDQEDITYFEAVDNVLEMFSKKRGYIQ